MPELPDIVVYVESLSARVGGQPLLGVLGPLVLGLIHPDAAAAWQADAGDGAPALLVDGGALDVVGGQLGDGRPDVVAQEVQLVLIPILAGVDSEFRGRQAEDQPAVP